MGCADSKLDGLPAVSICRGRSDLLADAIRHRYALSASHAAHAASLRSVADSLHRLLSSVPGDPVLPLPVQRKGDPDSPRSPPPTIAAPAPVAASSSHSHADSGDHIQFHPSDSECSGSGTSSDSDASSPIHHHHNLHYARGQPPGPSVSFAQPQPPPETVQFNSVEPPYYDYSYAPQNSNYSDSYFGYGGMGGGFFGASSPPAAARVQTAGVGPSRGAPPPPPPSPPRANPWEFLNPFEAAYETYYPPYTPSRSSREVREEEGIPELEELEQEVVKEAYGDEKSTASTSGAAPDEYSSKLPASSKNVGKSHYRSMSAGAGNSSGDEENVVEKNVAHEERRSVAVPAAPLKFPDASVAVAEIKVQFDRAANAAAELSRVLEVGKHQYHQKNSVYKASSKMISVMTRPSSSDFGDHSNFDDDIAMNTRSLSLTLQKLYIWEKKLYEEVKAEEKMRLLHDKSCKRLKRLDEKGAEANKIESIRTLINKLSTKIRIAIRVADSISNKINKLRDEELYLHINELILGFMRMWQIMRECHRNQCQAISEAKSLDSIADKGKSSDTHMDAVMQLELDLLRWIANFSDWIIAQKSFVKALNGWLVLSLHYEPEVTADGVPPYSPGRLGAPPVFVICNNWSQAMDRISEREVVDSMQAFAANVRHLWEQNNTEQRQMMMASKDVERWIKTREREQQTVHKELDALNKKLVLVPGHNALPLYPQVVHSSISAEVGSLQLGLKKIFEAMESFAASSVQAYEEAYLPSEE